MWRFRLSLSGCHGGRTTSDLSAGSWFSVPGPQIWSNFINMDEWEVCSSDFLYSYLLFHTKVGLSGFLPFTSRFPSKSHSCPSPTHQLPCPVSMPPPVRCPMPAALHPCLAGTFSHHQRMWEALSPVGGTSLPSTSSQCFSPSLYPIHISFLCPLFFLIFSFFIFF